MTAWKVVEGFNGLINTHAQSIRGFEIPMNWNSPTHPEFLTTDGRRLPINRMFCIAKNYEEHAKEMGGEVDRKAPFHFQKSFDVLTFGPEVRYPTQTDDLHHEVELVAVLGQGGRHLSLKDAEATIILVMRLASISHVVIVRPKPKKKAVLGKSPKILMMLE